ncbi:MAG TPA: peptide chain release factor N(5)-glutamine methyltransferase [Candidatus Avacidaminococcus intestinavium]|uniref:Release factor glutamine methyltransferase n=1 Tax=Candidatus Avacidaminococcus intestinavium TaxID=2840684 RepID=A0A9D1MQH6_9FIRM|nr:peptide chain release factor N(5)-glutamine methyltransferase [Candidatus Avacidaminococcus intestinavium]
MGTTQEITVWTIVKILDWTRQYFADKGVENPRLDAEILLCAVLNCPRIDLYVHFDRPLSPEELKSYKALVVRRANHEPIAYILGEKAFLDFTFKVTPAVLIPRPETELLVERLVLLNKKRPKVSFLDIGTGSGAISISLLKLLPTAVAVAVDLSQEALVVAEENAINLGVKASWQGVHSNLFQQLAPTSKFSFIVSNPPYIKHNEIALLANDVQKEPHMALDGGSGGLDFYEKIISEAQHYLEEDGLLAFEIGIYQAEAVSDLCKQAGFSKIVICKDYAGIERNIFAAKEGSDYGNALMEIE